MIRLAKFVRNSFSGNPDRRLRALKAVADRLLPGYRLTWSQIDWWHDSDFNSYLDHFGYRDTFHMQHRWMLWQLLRLVDGVEGDTAECGVWEGASSWLICAANLQKARTHHLFDSFEGLSAPSSADGNYWKPGALAATEALVLRNLKPFERSLVFHKGWIPDRFGDVAEKIFAFVHVDVDLEQPTRDSLEFFYPRLSPGAVFLCDDYGCTTCPGATAAIDSFLVDKPEKMITLDAGGGFFIKGSTTAARLAAMPASNAIAPVREPDHA
jgi:hypothetical protein